MIYMFGRTANRVISTYCINYGIDTARRVKVTGRALEQHSSVIKVTKNIGFRHDMSPSTESFEATWLAQLTSMREAIAGLKLDQSNGTVQEYGHDLLFEDDDFTGDSDNDDIWDVFSDEEEFECSSGSLDPDEGLLCKGETPGDEHGQAWLQSKCLAFTSGKSGLDASELQEQLSALLASDMRGTLKSIVKWA